MDLFIVLYLSHHINNQEKNEWVIKSFIRKKKKKIFQSPPTAEPYRGGACLAVLLPPSDSQPHPALTASPAPQLGSPELRKLRALCYSPTSKHSFIFVKGS